MTLLRLFFLYSFLLLSNFLFSQQLKHEITWNANTGQFQTDLKEFDGFVEDAIFSPLGKYILTLSVSDSSESGSVVKVWDPITLKLLANLKGHTGKIRTAIFSPDDKFILTASNDNTAKIWQSVDGHLLFDLRAHRNIVTRACFSPDGKYIVTSSEDGKAKLWETATGKELRTFRGDRVGLENAKFSPDGKYIMAEGSWDFIARIWDTNSGKVFMNLGSRRVSIFSAGYSPDGNSILTYGKDNVRGFIKIWDAKNGKETAFVNVDESKASINNAFYSPSGKYIFTSLVSGNVKLWEAATQKLLFVLTTAVADGTPCCKDTGFIISAAFSPDESQVVVTFFEGKTKIWETASGKLVADLKGHQGRVNNAVYSSDGKYLLTCSADKTIKKWNAVTGELLFTFFPFDEMDYLIIDKYGRYDGTEAAFKMFSFKCRDKMVKSDQLKELWVPRLAEKLMKGETISNAKLNNILICK